MSCRALARLFFGDEGATSVHSTPPCPAIGACVSVQCRGRSTCSAVNRSSLIGNRLFFFCPSFFSYLRLPSPALLQPVLRQQMARVQKPVGIWCLSISPAGDWNHEVVAGDLSRVWHAQGVAVPGALSSHHELPSHCACFNRMPAPVYLNPACCHGFKLR